MEKLDKGLLKQLIHRYEAAEFTVQRRLHAMVRELLPPELTADQYATLRYLNGRGVCTPSELADTFCVGKSSITAIITRLADKKLIDRVPDAKDRRAVSLSLTDEGKQLVERMEEPVEELLSRYLVHFNVEEAKAFIETYEKLASVLLQPAEGSEMKNENRP